MLISNNNSILRIFREGNLRNTSRLFKFNFPVLILFTKSQCPYCKPTINLIKELNINIDLPLFLINFDSNGNVILNEKIEILRENIVKLFEPKVYPTLLLGGHSIREINILEGAFSKNELLN